ncbi:MAG: hypothetical protein JWL68_351 [Actinomycetia bacterium]|nr:hypothetical protein [Actinomycetes bacterium]MDX6337096.1 hypothetical protein [Streptosporangiaceae bacterium]
MRTPDEDGLFGPGSVTWRIMARPEIFVGGFRAAYLQALHPRVMRGTWQHTAFADRDQAWGRFLRTAEFVRVRTYGSLAEVERAGRRVRKIHASLTGVDSDGTRFRLDEPELLLWVHCAEVSSYLDVARRGGMPLSVADADAFVAEQQRAAAVVGLDPAQVPGCAADLEAHITAMRPRLRVTPEARQAMLRSVNVRVPAAQLPLKLAVPSIGALAFASLPRWARRMYGTPGAVVTDLAATAALRAFHEGVARLPGGLLRAAA